MKNVFFLKQKEAETMNEWVYKVCSG